MTAATEPVVTMSEEMMLNGSVTGATATIPCFLPDGERRLTGDRSVSLTGIGTGIHDGL